MDGKIYRLMDNFLDCKAKSQFVWICERMIEILLILKHLSD